MLSEDAAAPVAAAHPFTAADVETILRERGWLAVPASAGLLAWCERAAALLGGHAADREALADFLSLIFHYDAGEILARTDSHIVLAREGARAVLRHLALLILEGGDVDSDRLKTIITSLKEILGFSGRGLFRPLRLALAGRAGEGSLDRVVLLLDSAARLPFAVPVKTARRRILEFCAAMD